MRSPSRQAMERLRRPAEPESLDELMAYVQTLSALGGLTRTRAHWLRLAAEELIVNIITHGHRDRPGELELTGGVEPGRVWLRLADSAPPFDPTAYEAVPDLDRPLGERRPGGLGVYLARTVADQVRYEYSSGRNQTTIIMNRV
ncbi:ATP-binding protein [Nonomuraea sp. NPDC004702]